MDITADLLITAISAVFDNEPKAAQDGKGIVFGIIDNEYFGRCCIEITEQADPNDPATCLVMFVYFQKDMDTNYDFRDIPDELLLDLCNEIDLSLTWSSLSLLKQDDGARTFQLNRTVRISGNVLAETIKQGGFSELHWGMFYLSQEFMLVAPIIDNLARGTNINPEHVHHFFTETTDHQHA